MRTKTLLLAAALTAAGLATSLAQSNVYSLNVVGYVNVVLPASTNAAGFALIANPLNQANNSLSNVIPAATVADATTVYLYSGTFQIATKYPFNPNPPFDGNPAWDFPNLQVAPGTGFWVKNASNAPVTLTFVGEVLQGARTNPIPAGFGLKGSIVPQAGQLDTVLGYSPTPSSTVIYSFKAVGGYTISTFYPFNPNPPFDANPNWDTPPVLDVAQGFWSFENGATNWIRTFNVQ